MPAAIRAPLKCQPTRGVGRRTAFATGIQAIVAAQGVPPRAFEKSAPTEVFCSPLDPKRSAPCHLNPSAPPLPKDFGSPEDSENPAPPHVIRPSAPLSNTSTAAPQNGCPLYKVTDEPTAEERLKREKRRSCDTWTGPWASTVYGNNVLLVRGMRNIVNLGDIDQLLAIAATGSMTAGGVLRKMLNPRDMVVIFNDSSTCWFFREIIKELRAARRDEVDRVQVEVMFQCPQLDPLAHLVCKIYPGCTYLGRGVFLTGQPDQGPKRAWYEATVKAEAVFAKKMKEIATWAYEQSATDQEIALDELIGQRIVKAERRRDRAYIRALLQYAKSSRIAKGAGLVFITKRMEIAKCQARDSAKERRVRLGLREQLKQTKLSDYMYPLREGLRRQRHRVSDYLRFRHTNFNEHF